LLFFFVVAHAQFAPDGTPVASRGLQQALIDSSLSTKSANLACLDALDCNSCLSESNCGWCQGKKCVPGGPSGPNSGTCTSWSFDYCPNQSECPYTTCSACLNDADCGWCSSSKHCFLGNASQPLDGNCPSSEYYYTSCPGSQTEATEYYITFGYSGYSCNVCGSDGYYICYDGTFANASSTEFQDPTPSGSTVVQIKLSMTGVFAQAANDFQVMFNVNNDTLVPIDVDVPPNSNGFTCDSPCTTLGGQTSEYLSGLPGWNYGGMNFIGWSGYSGYNACYSELDLTIVYTTDDHKTKEITIPRKH